MSACLRDEQVDLAGLERKARGNKKELISEGNTGGQVRNGKVNQKVIS